MAVWQSAFPVIAISTGWRRGKSRLEALPLVGIAIGEFRGDMVGGNEVVGVAGEEVCPVDPKEIDGTDASATMIVG